MSYITGSYFTYPRDDASGITPLGWNESFNDYYGIHSYIRDYDLWVLVCSNSKIHPLGKKWIKAELLTESHLPAKPPRPQLPDCFNGQRVIQVIRRDPRIVGAVRDKYQDEPSGKSSWTGWRYNQ